SALPIVQEHNERPSKYRILSTVGLGSHPAIVSTIPARADCAPFARRYVRPATVPGSLFRSHTARRYVPVLLLPPPICVLPGCRRTSCVHAPNTPPLECCLLRKSDRTPHNHP